jgi:hypothetical protein
MKQTSRLYAASGKYKKSDGDGEDEKIDTGNELHGLGLRQRRIMSKTENQTDTRKS